MKLLGLRPRLPRKLRGGKQEVEKRLEGKLANQRELGFVYLFGILFKVMYSISPGKKNQTERCFSFKMASPNVICGFCVVYFFSYQNSVKLSV